jgi:hypothetical protein
MISKHEVHIQIVSTESDKLLCLQSPNTCCFLAGDKPTTLSGSGRHLSGPVNWFCQKTRYFSWNVGTLACADHVNARIQIRLRDYYLCYLVDYTFCSPLYSQVASHPSTSLHICRIGQTSRQSSLRYVDERSLEPTIVPGRRMRRTSGSLRITGVSRSSPGPILDSQTDEPDRPGLARGTRSKFCRIMVRRS